MEKDSEVEEYKEHIKKHPKYDPAGELDENFFYNQPDASIHPLCSS